MKAGAVEFLTKPYKGDVLLQSVRNAVEKSKALLSRQEELQTLEARYAVGEGGNPRMASLPHDVEGPGDEAIRLVVDTIPTLAWSAGPDGSAEFFNQRWLDYSKRAAVPS
jgi:hypothetical protein